MEEIKRQITITEFKTSDGKIFSESDRNKAQIHQDILDGKKKLCLDCNGSGSKSEDHGEYGYFENWVQAKCTSCNGKGHLELKWS